jgi:excisionase family DNA binding protein
MKRYYSSRDVAFLIKSDPSSVNRWIDSGKLKAHRTPGGHRRVNPADLLEFLEQHGMPIPAELRASCVILIRNSSTTKKTVVNLAKGLRERAIEPVSVSCYETAKIEAGRQMGLGHRVVAVIKPGFSGQEVRDEFEEALRKTQSGEYKVINSPTTLTLPLARRFLAEQEIK